MPEFNLLLGSFEQEPQTCAEVLRVYFLSYRQAFLTDIRQAILTRPPSRALKYVVGLLTTHDLLHLLLREYVHSRMQAIDLGKKILLSDLRFDVKLIELVEELTADSESEQIVLCALDILDEISEREALVVNILRLLRHPSPNLRSKAARMIGRRRPNAGWMTKLMAEPDARVRANAIESLFRVPAQVSHELFRRAATDENNRVAGNARLGLYQLGDAEAVPLIEELAHDTRATFRNTGAWVMGQTQAPHFARMISSLIADPDDLVRRQAFQALARIKRALKANGG